jgi:hypothetical protein
MVKFEWNDLPKPYQDNFISNGSPPRRYASIRRALPQIRNAGIAQAGQRALVRSTARHISVFSLLECTPRIVVPQYVIDCN